VTDMRSHKPAIWFHSHGQVALAADLCRDALSDGTRDGLCALMRDHFIDLTYFDQTLAGYAAGGNIPQCRTYHAGMCALTWGEASGHPRWREVADRTFDSVRQYLRKGCDEDGYSYEGSGYGGGVFQFTFLMAVLFHRCGWPNLLEVEPVLERVADSYQQVLQGDHKFCLSTNDTGNFSPYSMWWLILTAKHYNRPDHLGFWHAYQGPEHPIRPWGDSWGFQSQLVGSDPRTQGGIDDTLLMTFLHYDAESPVLPIEQSPAPLATYAPGVGVAAFRTSWKANAIVATMLGGGRSTACFGHAHADTGHLNIAVGGEWLAIDTGRYNTNEDQHSVVIVDEQNALPSSGVNSWGFDRRSGRLEQFERHRMVETCTADAALMKNCSWANRHLFFVRLNDDDAYVVMLDNVNKDYENHTFQWLLQCHPNTKVEATGNHSACVRGEAARLDCSFFIKPEPPAPDHPHRLEVRADEQEWVWPYGRDQNIDSFIKLGPLQTVVRRPRVVAEVEGHSCVMLSVVSPRRSTQSPLKITQEAATNGLRIRVVSDDFVDTFIAAPDHRFIDSPGEQGTPGVRGFGEFSLIRQDPDGAVVDVWSPRGSDVRLTSI